MRRLTGGTGIGDQMVRMQQHSVDVLPLRKLALLVLICSLAVLVGASIGRVGAYSETILIVLLALGGSVVFLIAIRYTETIMAACLVSAGSVVIPIGFAGVKGVYAYEMLLVVVLVILVLRQAFRRQTTFSQEYPSLGPIEKSMLLFLGWAVLGYLMNAASLAEGLEFIRSLGLSADNLAVKLSLNGVLTLVVCFGAYFGGKNLFQDKAAFDRVCWAILLATTCSSILTEISWFQQTGGVLGRYNFVMPNSLGYGDQAGLSLVGFLVAFALFTNAPRSNKTVPLVVCMLINAFGLILIQSRASYLYAIARLGLLFLLLRPWGSQQGHRASRYAASWFIAVAFTAVLIGAILQTDLRAALTGLVLSGSEDVGNKDSLSGAAWNVFLSHPVFGVGWGYYILYSRVPVIVTGQSVYVATPHNGVLQLLAETGIGGFVLAMLVSLLLLVQTWTAFRAISTPPYRALTAVALVIVIVAVLGQLIQSSLFFPPGAQRSGVIVSFYAWFLVGYVQRLRRIDNISSQGSSRTVVVAVSI